MPKRLGIIGSGVMGLWVALIARKLGFSDVMVFEKDAGEKKSSSSHVAVGMLSPYCEREYAEEGITKLGLDSLGCWRALSQESPDVKVHLNGTLVLGFPRDRAQLDYLLDKVPREVFSSQDMSTFSAFHPDIQDGYFFAEEGHVEVASFMSYAQKTLKHHIRFEESVTDVAPFEIQSNGVSYDFDVVIDCRGLGAKKDLNFLRGVRGEKIELFCPEVSLPYPVRLMHPRYPLYICPKKDHRFMIGASIIESEDPAPISVQTSLELLSAAYSVIPAFSQARLVETSVGIRPTYGNHLPKITSKPGLIHINGLYRHGYLVAPSLAKKAMALVIEGEEERKTQVALEAVA